MKVVIAAAAILLTILIIGVAIIPKGIEPLTELYFDNHLNLPQTAEINKEYKFSFAIHNLEYKDMAYRYEIVLEHESKKFTMDDGLVYIKQDETKHIQGSFIIEQEFERAKITVNIVNKDQQIHFWVNKS